VFTFSVSHNASAPYDLLLSGGIADYPNPLLYGTPVFKLGPGLMVMSGSNTYIGPTTINGGTLQIGNGGSGEAMASNSISVSSGAVLAFNHSDTLTISPTGVISGGGTLLNLGGLTKIAGSTTYTGPTTVNGGTLQLKYPTAQLNNVTVANGAGLTANVGVASEWSVGNIDALLSNSAFASGAGLGFDTTDGAFTYGSNITAAVSVGKFGPTR